MFKWIGHLPDQNHGTPVAYLGSFSISENVNILIRSTTAMHSAHANVTKSVGWLCFTSPIYCPLRRTWSLVNTPFPPRMEPRAVALQSITLPLSHASSTTKSITWLKCKSKVTNHYRHKLHIRRCTFKYFPIMHPPIFLIMVCYIIFKQVYSIYQAINKYQIMTD